MNNKARKSVIFKTRVEGHNEFSELRIYFLISAVVLVLDQLTKRLIESEIINVKYIYNRGAALGLLKNLSVDVRVPLFAVISIAAFVFILYYMRTLEINDRISLLGLALILGGAMGNFIDRVYYKQVLDFIDVGFWPVFNLADSAISTGVALILFRTIFPLKENKQSVSKEMEK